MLSSLDKHFAFSEAALKLRATRQEVIASNIANADTPGYKARDFDFSQALNNAVVNQRGPQGMGMAVTDKRHLVGKTHSVLEADLLYRNDVQPSVDGNTVDMNIEMSNFTDNAIRYQASLTFLQKRIEGMRAALQTQ